MFKNFLENLTNIDVMRNLGDTLGQSVFDSIIMSAAIMITYTLFASTGLAAHILGAIVLFYTLTFFFKNVNDTAFQYIIRELEKIVSFGIALLVVGAVFRIWWCNNNAMMNIILFALVAFNVICGAIYTYSRLLCFFKKA